MERKTGGRMKEGVQSVVVGRLWGEGDERAAGLGVHVEDHN